MKHLLAFFLVVALFGYCRERPHDNIFDPNNPARTMDIGLRVGGLDSTIVLDWNRPRDVEFLSYLIYRQQEGERSFRRIAQLPVSQTRYVDSLILADVTYRYYLTLQGREKESLPTEVKSSITGPGHIWMIDGYFFEVQQISYDMNQLNKRIFGIWLPENIAFHPGGKTALITYPLFNYVQIVLLDTGEELAFSNDFHRPYDALFNTVSGRYWLTDSSGGFYSVDPRTLEFETLSTVPRKATQIRPMGDRFVITDKGIRGLWLFSATGEMLQRIPKAPDAFIEDILTVRTDSLRNRIYILSRRPGNSKIYRYDVAGDSLSLFFADSLINAFDLDPVRQTVWVARATPGSFEILKLSLNGQRLDSVSGINWPVDIAVNRYNHHIVVADPKSRELIHFKEDLQEIGRFKSNGEPVKVYIE